MVLLVSVAVLLLAIGAEGRLLRAHVVHLLVELGKFPQKLGVLLLLLFVLPLGPSKLIFEVFHMLQVRRGPYNLQFLYQGLACHLLLF